MGEEVRKTSGEALDSLSKRIGIIAVVLGVVISINTLVTGCTREKIDRQTSFRAAVRGEEEYWLQLYSQYMEALDMPVGEKRNAKLAVVEALLDHQVPVFTEYDSWWSASTEAAPTYQRLDGMKQRLKLLLMGKSTNDPARAQELAWRLSEAATQRPRLNDGEVAPAAISATAAEAVARPSTADFSYATRILAVGQAKGWDVDIFWCAGPGEQDNFRVAAGAAGALARLADARKPIGSNTPLGRIRLRSLPESRARALLPQPGNLIVADSGAGEGAVADAILAGLAAQGISGFGRANSSGAPTSYYISGFACRPVTVAAAQSR